MKPDLFDLFRQQQEQTPPRDRPSPLVWRKLERRLDRHDQLRHRAERFSILWVYLLLLLVVLLVPVIVALILRDQQQAYLRQPAPQVQPLDSRDSVPGLRQLLERSPAPPPSKLPAKPES